MIQYGIALIEFFILFMDVFMCLVQLVYFFRMLVFFNVTCLGRWRDWYGTVRYGMVPGTKDWQLKIGVCSGSGGIFRLRVYFGFVLRIFIFSCRGT